MQLTGSFIMQEPQIADDDLLLPKIRVGICAMDKKARSRPMKAIIERMLAFGEFEIITFGDDVIVSKPISEWPHCECLLSWHSDGFPLSKVQYSSYNLATLSFLYPVTRLAELKKCSQHVLVAFVEGNQ